MYLLCTLKIDPILLLLFTVIIIIYNFVDIIQFIIRGALSILKARGGKKLNGHRTLFIKTFLNKSNGQAIEKKLHLECSFISLKNEAMFCYIKIC